MPTAFVVINDTPINQAANLLLRPGENVLSGERELTREFGSLTSLEVDLLNLAASIFSCDIAFKRGEREEFTRHIRLTIPVVNLASFERVKNELIYALYLLSNDAWQIDFVQSHEGNPERPQEREQDAFSKILLFSGGIDSLAEALLLGESGDKVQLVSHTTNNRTVSGGQETLFGYLQTNFPDQFERISFHVSGRDRLRNGYTFPSDKDREETQRTRSFMFLSLAGLIARRRGIPDVVFIAENGQMAIHLPLSAARISSFSTHTAHPEFICTMEQLLSTLLSFRIHIDNPFLYLTKAEVVRRIIRAHSNVLGHTISCWKSSRLPGEIHHCGICVPCLVRRIALENNGVMLSEYVRDLFSENVISLPPDDDGKRNLIELGEFVKLFERRSTDAELLQYFPELINPSFDLRHAIDMYRRFAFEARAVFNKYPTINRLLV